MMGTTGRTSNAFITEERPLFEINSQIAGSGDKIHKICLYSQKHATVSFLLSNPQLFQIFLIDLIEGGAFVLVL